MILETQGQRETPERRRGKVANDGPGGECKPACPNEEGNLHGSRGTYAMAGTRQVEGAGTPAGKPGICGLADGERLCLQGGRKGAWTRHRSILLPEVCLRSVLHNLGPMWRNSGR